MVLLAGSLMAADKDDVSAAIAKLAAADNYSWKSTSTNFLLRAPMPMPPAADAAAGEADSAAGRWMAKCRRTG